METEVLSAKEIVSRFDTLGDVDRERRLAYFVVSVLAHMHGLSHCYVLTIAGPC